MSLNKIIDVSKVITHTIDSVTNYLKVKEVEKTERERVIACLNMMTKTLETDRMNFEFYLEKAFEERERLYKTMDQLIVCGMQENDIELVKLATSNMLIVYNKNVLDGWEGVKENTQRLSSSTQKYIG